MRRHAWIAGTITTALLVASGGAPDSVPRALAQDAPAGAAPAPADPADPVVVRRRLLARLDARIDEACAKAHLDARLALDAVLPIPYVGFDADEEAGGLRVTHVYPATSAEAMGLREGDAVLSFDGQPTATKAALGGAIRRRRVGDRFEMRVRRAGAEVALAATLGQRPEEDEDEDEQFPELGGPAAPPAFAPTTLDFERDEVGSAPAGLEGSLGGHGLPPRWLVVAEAQGRFVRQDDADPTGIRFPMALVKGVEGHDVVAKVRFRYAGGKVDRAAGLVLRLRDPSNYLVARVNAAEADLRIFRTVNGLRRTLPGARAPAPTDDDRWHTLEFRAEGARLTATLDGKTTVTSYDTYLRGGRVGVWTKSDSRTDFDDLSVAPAPR